MSDQCEVCADNGAELRPDGSNTCDACRSVQCRRCGRWVTGDEMADDGQCLAANECGPRRSPTPLLSQMMGDMFG